jgi:hypothetical protein
VWVAIAAAFILVWMNLAVGIIRDEGNPANLMFGGVIAVGVICAVFARFQPQGMIRALVTTAGAQALVAAIALTAGWSSTVPASSWSIILLTGLFVGLWLTAAWLFWNAGLDQVPDESA